MSLSFSGLKEEQAASLCQLRPLGPDPRCRHRRRRLIYKVAPLTVSSTRRPALAVPEASALTAAAGESGQRGECERERESAAPSGDQVSCRVSVPLPHSNPAPDNSTSQLNSTPQMEAQVHEVQFGVKQTIFTESVSVFNNDVMHLEENGEAFQRIVSRLINPKKKED